MPAYPLVAVSIGLAVGITLGGRLHHLARARFRWWGLLVAGLGLQAVVEVHGVAAPFTVLLASYAGLLGFVAANLSLSGMGLVFIGIALNLAVIAANGGMPVRESAARAAGMVGPRQVMEIEGAKHVREADHTRLRVLGDIVPVAAMRQVLSFGDLIISVGVADLVVTLMRPRRRRAPAPAPAGRLPRPPVPVAEGAELTRAR
jgi:Family of unknown function (DUF5317)